MAVSRPVPSALAENLQMSFRRGLVSARLENAPLQDVLRQLAAAAGAEVRGSIPEDRRVDATFTDLELRPALERFLGDLSFALVYDAEGRLRTIELRGGPVEEAADTGVRDSGLDLAAWPPNEAVAQAAEHLHAYTLSDRTIPVWGLLRRALGADAVPFRRLAEAAVGNDDSRVRAHAARAAVRALERDDEERQALVLLLEGAGDGLVADYLRRAGGERAAELAAIAARGARTPAVRMRFRAVAARLRASSPPR